MSDFAWNLRVRSAGDGRATAYMRAHQFEIGAPLHFDPQYAGVTALEHVLAALGADLVNGLLARCRPWGAPRHAGLERAGHAGQRQRADAPGSGRRGRAPRAQRAGQRLRRDAGHPAGLPGRQRRRGRTLCGMELF
jgi:hypothetical protein